MNDFGSNKTLNLPPTVLMKDMRRSFMLDMSLSLYFRILFVNLL
jgi:hypothetical protein